MTPRREKQISDAIPLVMLYNPAPPAFAHSPLGLKLSAHIKSQEALLEKAIGSGEITREHVMAFLNTPLLSSSRVPDFLGRAVENSGENRTALLDCISRACRSKDTKMRINASISMIGISRHFPPVPRLFQLQSILSSNMFEWECAAVTEAAAKAIVGLCREEGDPGLTLKALEFFNEQSSMFITYINEIHALGLCVSRSPPKSLPNGRKTGIPSKYPTGVSKRPRLTDAPPRRTNMGTVRPPLHTKNPRPGLKIPKEHSY